MKTKTFINDLMRQAGMGIVLVLMIAAFAIIKPDPFITIQNVKNVFNQITTNTILAVGMTFVILIGGIDLSVGSVMALTTVVAGAWLSMENLPAGLAIVLAILASLAVGSLCGFTNGFVSTFWRLPSFIVTMGMLYIARGIALLGTDARTIYIFHDEFKAFGRGTVLGNTIPLIFIVALVLVAIGQFVLKRTVFGRMLLAIGNNEEAVRLSGKNTSIVKILAFTICGVCAGIAGVVLGARLGVAMPIIGQGAELDAIAAVIIGGTSLFGGRGSFVGTFIGACIMGVLNNGLTLMGLGDFHRMVVTGVVIILAVILDVYRARVAVGVAEQA